MNSVSSGTGRVTPPKIEVECRCGKKYRVSAEKAGKKLRCKKCRSKLVVPGGKKGQISMRSRKAILAEFGIDAEEATERYEAKKDKTYTCSACSAEIPESKLKSCYSDEGLRCGECRTKDKKKKSESDEGLDRWTTARSTPQKAKKKALGMSALFGLGSAGFVHTFFGPAAWITVSVALAVAALGGRTIYNHELNC